jgi:hypothetical protein
MCCLRKVEGEPRKRSGCATHARDNRRAHTQRGSTKPIHHGGKHNFTDWRGLSDENQFYTNPLVISDFEQYISVLLNHINSYNGIAYKNDPTILAWETGNELSAPAHWVQTIATYNITNTSPYITQVILPICADA